MSDGNCHSKRNSILPVARIANNSCAQLEELGVEEEDVVDEKLKQFWDCLRQPILFLALWSMRNRIRLAQSGPAISPAPLQRSLPNTNPRERTAVVISAVIQTIPRVGNKTAGL